MDMTILTGLAQLGSGFALAAAILLLHREALEAFRKEMAEERKRNDANHVEDRKRSDASMMALLTRMDLMGNSWRCQANQLPMNRWPDEASPPE